jgi:hypothetical protein
VRLVGVLRLFWGCRWTFNAPQHPLPLDQVRLVYRHLTRSDVATRLGVQALRSNQHSLHCRLQYTGSTPGKQCKGSTELGQEAVLMHSAEACMQKGNVLN